jgi:pimeloyl-ACP methyl ester carboxylesterase
MKENLILLPGFDGYGKKTFTKLVGKLKDDYKILVVDYPYIGKPNKSYSLEELIGIIDDVAIENKFDKFHLLGFSMGGFVASEYASKHPKKIESIILVSSAIFPIANAGLKNLITILDFILRWPWLATILTRIYLSPKTAKYTKNFPVPKMGPGFPAKEGFSTYGTLAKVIRKIVTKIQNPGSKNIKMRKLAILFEDDKSFPAKDYGPLLEKYGFKIKTISIGGHNESKDYWEKVAKSIA